MIDFELAKKIAKEYYDERGMDKLTKVYESNDIWVVYATKDGKIRYGGHGIAINKETGEISDFILPSKENFEILRNAKLTVLE